MLWRGLERELGAKAEIVEGTHALTGCDAFVNSRIVPFAARVLDVDRGLREPELQ